jgi:hypothetical protein
MSHPDQLRQYARDCLRLSQDMTSPELKIHLINMAEAWAALASQSERIAALCATVPSVVSGPLAPESERANGTGSNGIDRGAMESPALSPESAEHEHARAAGDGRDRRDG